MIKMNVLLAVFVIAMSVSSWAADVVPPKEEVVVPAKEATVAPAQSETEKEQLQTNNGEKTRGSTTSPGCPIGWVDCNGKRCACGTGSSK